MSVDFTNESHSGSFTSYNLLLLYAHGYVFQNLQDTSQGLPYRTKVDSRRETGFVVDGDKDVFVKCISSLFSKDTVIPAIHLR